MMVCVALLLGRERTLSSAELDQRSFNSIPLFDDADADRFEQHNRPEQLHV